MCLVCLPIARSNGKCTGGHQQFLSSRGGVDIAPVNANIPTLQLGEQVTPVGSETGQLSVVDGRLYLYDATRVKWLSIETEAMMFGENSPNQGIVSRFGGDLQTNNSEPLMPFNGTIVYATGRLGIGDADKVITIRIRRGTATPTVEDISFSASEFRETDLNIDFQAGDYITVFIEDDGAGNTISEHVEMLWVKWRL